MRDVFVFVSQTSLPLYRAGIQRLRPVKAQSGMIDSGPLPGSTPARQPATALIPTSLRRSTTSPPSPETDSKHASSRHPSINTMLLFRTRLQATYSTHYSSSHILTRTAFWGLQDLSHCSKLCPSPPAKFNSVNKRFLLRTSHEE